MKGQFRVPAVAVSLVVVLSIITALALSACAASVPATETETTNRPVLRDTQTRSRDEMTMVYVPTGQFEMGSSDADLDAAMQACAQALGEEQNCQRDKYLDEQPAHAVTLDAFWIDKTEVTNAQFSEFLNDQGNQAEDGISWLEPAAGHRGVEYGQIEEVGGVFGPREGYEDYHSRGILVRGQRLLLLGRRPAAHRGRVGVRRPWSRCDSLSMGG